MAERKPGMAQLKAAKAKAEQAGTMVKDLKELADGLADAFIKMKDEEEAAEIKKIDEHVKGILRDSKKGTLTRADLTIEDKLILKRARVLTKKLK